MIPTSSPRAQRGAVLIVGLIVLMLITLMVTAAFKFSTYNLKSVGNMQAHNEAIAAANKAIEKMITSWDFSTPAPDHSSYGIDIDNSGGVDDYTVAVDKPVCIKATPMRIAGSSGKDCIKQQIGAGLECESRLGEAIKFNVVWDVPATATSRDGTYVRVHQGISLSLTKSQCNAACPPSTGPSCI
jgi:hypothetical protein